MPRFPIGVELSSLRLPFKQSLYKAAELGVDTVSIDARGEVRPGTISGTGIRQLRKLLEDLRLRVGSVTFQTRRGYEVEQDLEQRITATKQALDFAHALGTQIVTNQVGTIASDAEHRSWNVLRDALSDIGRHAQRAGAFLAGRTGGESADDLRRLIDALPDGTLFVDFDPGNLIVNGFSARDSLPILGKDIVHLHATDGVKDLARGRGIEVTLGRGSVDYPEVMAMLDQIGYRGVLTIERTTSDQPLVEIADAVAYLRSVE